MGVAPQPPDQEDKMLSVVLAALLGVAAARPHQVLVKKKLSKDSVSFFKCRTSNLVTVAPAALITTTGHINIARFILLLLLVFVIVSTTGTVLDKFLTLEAATGSAATDRRRF